MKCGRARRSHRGIISRCVDHFLLPVIIIGVSSLRLNGESPSAAHPPCAFEIKIGWRNEEIINLNSHHYACRAHLTRRSAAFSDTYRAP